MAHPDLLIPQPLSCNGHPQELQKKPTTTQKHIYSFTGQSEEGVTPYGHQVHVPQVTSPCCPRGPPQVSESAPSPPRRDVLLVPSSRPTAELGSPEGIWRRKRKKVICCKTAGKRPHDPSGRRCRSTNKTHSIWGARHIFVLQLEGTYTRTTVNNYPIPHLTKSTEQKREPFDSTMTQHLHWNTTQQNTNHDLLVYVFRVAKRGHRPETRKRVK